MLDADASTGIPRRDAIRPVPTGRLALRGQKQVWVPPKRLTAVNEIDSSAKRVVGWAGTSAVLESSSNNAAALRPIADE